MLVGINTTIGWPTTYSQHSIWSVLGFLVISLLIGASVCFLLRIDDLRGRGFGRIAVGLLVAAGLLLQSLPHTENGIEFLPSLPWHYTNWIAGTISVVCWFCFLEMAIFSVAPSPEEESMIAGSALLGLAVTALLSPWTVDVPTKLPVVPRAVVNQHSEKPDDCDQLVRGWKTQRLAAENVLERLEEDRQRLADSPKSSSPVITAELAELDGQIETMKKEIDRMDGVILGIESKLRRVDRRKAIAEAGTLDEEREKSVRTEAELEEEMRAGSGMPLPLRLPAWKNSLPSPHTSLFQIPAPGAS